MSVESLKIKSAVVDEIKAKLDGAKSVVIIDYMGSTVEEATAMRKALREAGVDYTVYKNTLISKAIAGTDYEALSPALAGPTAIAISKDDAVAPARIIQKAMKDTNKMSFKLGIVEGVTYDAAGLQTLASIPSRDELIAKFLGSIQSPVGKFVRTLAAISDEKAKEA